MTDNFATRVIRMRQQNGLDPFVSEASMDPTALAAENINLLPRRETGVFDGPRASSLQSCCIRQVVIGTALKKKQTQTVGPAMRLIFDVGDATHYFLQNRETMFGNRRRGWWRCMACDSVLYFGRPPQDPCRKCGARPEAIEYHEHPLKIDTEQYQCSGHPDMFFEKADGRHRVIELKTMTSRSFATQTSPMVDHVWQVLLYAWGCSLDKTLPVDIDPDVAYVAYISKEIVTGSLPVKIFHVQATAAIMRRIKAKLELYKIGVDNFPNQLPPLNPKCVAKDFENWEGRSCPCLSECRDFGA